MSTKTYYISEEEGRAAEIEGSSNHFVVRVFGVGFPEEKEFGAFADAESYVVSSDDWIKCSKRDFDAMLVELREEGDAILEDYFPGITTDDNFDDFPSFLND